MGNAGLNTAIPPRTADGFNTIFGVNYLGHFALVNALLPLLARPRVLRGGSSGANGSEDPDPARVVLLSSVMHQFGAGRFRAAAEAGPHAHGVYSDSKLAMSVLAEELSRRFAAAGLSRRVIAVSVNPGAVSSDFGQGLSPACL